MDRCRNTSGHLSKLHARDSKEYIAGTWGQLTTVSYLYFIKILDSFNDFNAQDKINIEKFSDKMKLNFVYNYLVKNQIINK